MRCWQQFLLWLAAFLVTVNPVAADDSPQSSRALKDDPAPSRRALEEKARQDPEWYQRTLRDLDAFQSLPPDQQERMRELDRQLNAQDARTRQKLMRALERYSAWMDRLTPADRKYIENAPNSKERLKRIREVRDKQWVQTQPKAVREEIMRAKGKERQELIQKYRQEEKKRRQEWETGMKRGNTPPRAGRFSDEQQKKNQSSK
jgi:hypothetical protein